MVSLSEDSHMTLGKDLTRRVVLLGAFAIMIGPAVAQTPSPALVITSRGKGSSDCVLQIVDPLTRRVVARVPVSGHPHEVTVSTDGKFAFVTNSTLGSQWLNYPTVGVPKNTDPLPEDTISVIDLAAQRELALIDVGPGSEPHGITFATGKVYFTAEGYKLVGRYDPASNRIDWMAGIGQNRVHQLVLTKDATKLFTANIGSDTVAALRPWDPAVDMKPYQTPGHDPPPPWNATLILVGKGPEGIAMSPSEKEVWVLTRGNGGVSIIDTAKRNVIQTVDLKTKDPLRIAFTPDGSRVLIADGESGDIMVLDSATRKEIKRIKDVGKQIHALVVAPDGSLAYAAAQSDDNIAIIDMKKLEVTDRIPVGAESEGMAWAAGK
jgi:YVTN family beta-propeller protein